MIIIVSVGVGNHIYPLIVYILNRQYRVAGITAGNTDNSLNSSA